MLEENLPKFVEQLLAAKANITALTKGVSRFVQLISDLTMDAPKLPQVFWKAVMLPLIRAKKLAIDKIQWLEDDEVYSCGGHFKIMAYLIE